MNARSVLFDGFLAAQLDTLKDKGQFRDPWDAGARARVGARATELGVGLLDCASNDYLGLARSVSADVSRETVRSGAGASRLVQGTYPEHEALERDLADWVALPCALLFSSGFAANLGVLSALAGPDSAVISDRLNHASLIDGCRLSRAQVTIAAHRDLASFETALVEHREAVARWVVTESYFSMDGDCAPLSALRALCDRHSAYLVVDEAHALGVFGPEGGGLCRHSFVRPDVLVGGLGKGVGAQGGFVAGSETLRTFLWNSARSFMFSTAASPSLSARTRQHVGAARRADRERSHLAELCAALRAALKAEGLPVLAESQGPILPLLAGSGSRALALAEKLRELGILAQAIRPPTVAIGAERLRLTLNARHSFEDVERLVTALASSWRAGV